MTFHRLANPSYFIPGGGPLLPGYDLLNDPTTTGGTGIPVAPDPGPKVGGTNDGVYFICDGAVEPANAYNLNRPARAVAESIDILDDAFHQSIATNTTAAITAGGGGDVSTTLNGSTTNIFVGDVAVSASDIFFVFGTLGVPLYVDGVRVTVASITGAVLGTGFTSANPLTLTFNKTIPAGTNYFVNYTVRSYFKAFPVGTLSYGVANASLNYESYRYDDDVVTVSNPSGGPRGDYHATSLTGLITGVLGRGDVVLRAGAYTIDGSDHWTEGSHVRARRLADLAKISIAVGRASNVNLSSTIAFHDVSLGTASVLNYHYVAQNNFVYEATASATVEAGALELNGASTGYSQRLRNLVLSANATLTTSTAGLKLTGLAALDMDNCSLESVPAGATAHMLIDTYSGRAHIRNCRIGSSVSGIDGLRINAVANTFGRVLFENCNIVHTGTGDAWAVRVINSFGVHFKNCRFISTRGQAVRVENSGVTFEDCTFEGDTNTTLASPQLVCGEGYVSGDLTARLSFIRCRAIISAANIRTTGAPTKPIIELGGHDAAAVAGPVYVDKFLIEMETSALGVHCYTTVVLHGNNDNTEVSSYNGITIDMKSNVPAAAGTLAQFGGFNGDGLVVEVIGHSTKCPITVRDLQLLNVGWPTTAPARSVLGAIYANIDGIVLDGTGSAAGSYSGPLMDMRVGRYSALSLFPTAGLKSTYAGGACIMYAQANAQVTGMRYHHRATNAAPATALFGVGIDSLIADSQIYIDQNFTSGTAIVKYLDNRASLRNVNVFLDGTSTGPVVDGNSKAECVLEGSTFLWKNANTNTIAALNTFTLGSCIGNKFLCTTANLPTVNYVNATGVPLTANFATLNTVALSASSTVPNVYT